MTSSDRSAPTTQAAQDAKQQAIAEALALQRQGKRELAMQRYVGILADDPQNLDALFNVAVIALQEGQMAEGVKVIERALAVGPPQGRLHNLMGQACLRMNRDEDALAAFERAIACEPGFADAYGNRANVLADMGRLAEAVASFDQALAVRPDNAEDLCNRGSVLADLGRYAEALADYERALALLPDLGPAHFNRADILMRFGRLNEALASYDRAIAISPQVAEAHSNRSVTLKEMGRLTEARASLESALELQPDFTEALVNRGNVAFEQGRIEEAQADYARALELNPDYPAARYGRGLACMTQGDWQQGFPLYEARENIANAPYVPPRYPRWDGGPLGSERLVLLHEQGLGDLIQFCRFGPILAAQGIDVTLLVPQNMRALLSTLKGVELATPANAPAPNGRQLRWLALMSAPGALQITPDNVPAPVPYLAAEPARVNAWRRRLGTQGFKIGINWSPGPAKNWFDGRRAIPLELFAPLAALPDVRLISLQRGPQSGEVAQAPFRDRIEVPDVDPDPSGDRFLDTAAVMMALDLVVTCDTSIAHLAGALARPVFTALTDVPDWRWLRGRQDCPWYPTMRLFRQSKPQVWSDVVAKIATAAEEMMKG
jgi:tetratricopeptide (TPR) repeat protein